MQKIEHLGIAVKDLEKSIELFTKLLGTPCYKKEYVDSENVHTAFFQCGPNKIELLSTSVGISSISKYVERRGEGIHHIALSVSDIYSEIARLEEAGFQVLEGSPKPGADNKLIAFLHPRDTNGVLIELCQDMDNTHPSYKITVNPIQSI